MCYRYSISSKPEVLEKKFSATFTQPFTPKYHVFAFSEQKLPVITNKNPDKIQLFSWGLIPFWTKDNTQAKIIQKQTANARVETIYEKPAFRHAAKHHHCLILADGFFEWRQYKDLKYPYYIYLKNREPFAFAGLWDEWEDKQNNQIIYSFSILTTTANKLLEKIHNTKKRMPVIVEAEKQPLWISNSFKQEDIQQLLASPNELALQTHTISRLFTSKTKEDINSDIITAYRYETLPSI